VDTPEVEVRRSRRRRRTVSAYREDGRTVVLIPARFSKAEERQWVATMLDRLAAGDRRRNPSDEELTARAEELSRRYLGGLAKPLSIRWVENQQSRWGSCTPADGTIRISTRVRGMPGFVLDYVVLHELAHLIVPGHGKDFWTLVGGFPRMERARGYLEGVAAAAHLDLAPADLARADAEEAAEQDGVAALEVGEEVDE
jgi:predicted metal-dependent hydrolase